MVNLQVTKTIDKPGGSGRKISDSFVKKARPFADSIPLSMGF
jgi:hypothetical protein